MGVDMQEDPDQVKSYAESNGYDWTLVVDVVDGDGAVTNRFFTSGIPIWHTQPRLHRQERRYTGNSCWRSPGTDSGADHGGVAKQYIAYNSFTGRPLRG
jgi:hypothetical protein